ncbi:hypothetical protein [Actinomadura chokoriensis]|uniref:hypothetical protein n=1 Tax=Actinomadura chokoriensis TaxID=454156 RepID=UPI0031F74838
MFDAEVLPWPGAKREITTGHAESPADVAELLGVPTGEANYLVRRGYLLAATSRPDQREPSP